MKHEHEIIVGGEVPVIHLRSEDGEFKYEQSVTIGASDGKDALSTLTDEQLSEHLQTLLNQKKTEHETILTNRKRALEAAKTLK